MSDACALFCLIMCKMCLRFLFFYLFALMMNSVCVCDAGCILSPFVITRFNQKNEKKTSSSLAREIKFTNKKR